MIGEISFKLDDLRNVSDIKASVINYLRNGNKSERKSYGLLRDSSYDLVILKKSVDARKKNDIRILVKYEIDSKQEFIRREKELCESVLVNYSLTDKDKRPVVIGFGPAGIFASLVLVENGFKPLIIERGTSMEKRISDIENHTSGKSPVKLNSNIQFGEGGAGTFSDGKLHTGIKSDYIKYVLKTFRDFGATEDILFEANPHIGTDYLRKVIVNIREYLLSKGAQIRFETTFKDFDCDNDRLKSVKLDDGNEIKADGLILAIGHSSRDTFRIFNDKGVRMENKPFSVGVRIEHLRTDIDMAQYGVFTDDFDILTPADYKAAVMTSTGKKLYTFCMCPGGYVMSSSSDDKSICTNGMSNYLREGINSNSALLVPVDSTDYGDGVLAGIDFQEELEHKAFAVGGSDGNLPVSTYGYFAGKTSSNEIGRVVPTAKPGYLFTDIKTIFSPVVNQTISEGIELIGKRIKGFDESDSVLTAVEARSSSPVRILRDDDTFQSLSVKGMFPCGEGAGYAGGITSSAVDGIKCALKLIKYFAEEQ